MTPIPEQHLPDLRGLRVLVTRPAHQASPFVQLVKNAGAQTIELPCIEIAYRNRQTLSADDKAIAMHSDWWIFTSANAVTGANKCGLLPLTNPGIKIATIGQATDRSLNELDVPVELSPQENSKSEQLLDLIKAQIKAGDKISIIRGDSGREKLKHSLQSLEVDVHYLEVYQRLLPVLPGKHIEELITAALPCVITITSDLGITNLLQLIPAPLHEPLFGCPLIVNSERCAELANSLGFSAQILVAHPPGDAGQIHALSEIQQP